MVHFARVHDGYTWAYTLFGAGDNDNNNEKCI